MKHTLFITLIIGLLSGTQHAQAQTGTQEPTTQEDTYKASEPGWEVDLNVAAARSKETGKPIFAFFTGSDWCGWCHKLKREVLDKDQFKTWAKENVIILELDFPRRTQIPQKYRDQNGSLQQAFGVRGYPTIWVFDMLEMDGQAQLRGLAKTGYVSGGPSAFIKDLETKLKATEEALKNEK